MVSTRIGAEGVPYVDGEHLLLADSPRDFVMAVLRLLNNHQLRNRLAGNGARFARRNYDWRPLCQMAVGALDSLPNIGSPRDKCEALKRSRGTKEVSCQKFQY